MKIEIKFYGSGRSPAKIGVRWDGRKVWSEIGPRDVQHVDGVPYDFSDLKDFGEGLWIIPESPKPTIDGMVSNTPVRPKDTESDELAFDGKLRRQDHAILSANRGRKVVVHERPAILIHDDWTPTLGAQPCSHVVKVDFRSVGSSEAASPEAQDLVSRMLWEAIK